MEQASQALFTVGTIVLAIAFAAFVGHAVLLANGRRAIAASTGLLAARVPQPAWAGVASGSFVAARAAEAERGPADFAAPSPLSRTSTWLGVAAFALLAASMVIRAYLVG